jgi:transcriptional regulator with XRE-family HTH domain
VPPVRHGRSPTPALELGARIRAERERAELSVRGLARRIGVSPSLLSQIERGLAQPSVGTLWALVRELGLSLDSLFAGEREAEAAAGGTAVDPGAGDGPAEVQRAADRSSIELASGVRWERLTAGADPDVDFAHVTYQPGADSGAVPLASHPGREYGYVLEGRLRIQVGDEEVELGPGDAIRFGSRIPHRLWVAGTEPVRTVWFNLAAPA